jgi:hypothetical protein
MNSPCAFAAMDKLGWHTGDGLPDAAVLVTRGADNGKLIADHCSPDATVYAFIQNDVPNANGSKPAEKWLADVGAFSGCKVLQVTTPGPHKDLNDWTRAGATKADIEAAIKKGKPIDTGRLESVAPSRRDEYLSSDAKQQPASANRVIQRDKRA